MNKSTPDSPNFDPFDQPIKLLGGKDTQKAQEAARALCRMGPAIVPFLIQAATRPGKRSQHRIAILDIIQQIGEPLELMESIDLQYMLRSRSPAIRAKVEEVILSVSPCGVPDNPIDLALIRLFHPRLRVPPRLRPSRRQRAPKRHLHRLMPPPEKGDYF